jgi:hypothetical protein
MLAVMPWNFPFSHDTERLERHKTFAGFGLDRFRCEKALGVVGVVVTRERAFLDLGDAVADRLSHFLRHQLGVFAGVVPQHLRRLVHQAGAARKVYPPPREKRFMRLADRVLNAGIRHCSPVAGLIAFIVIFQASGLLRKTLRRHRSRRMFAFMTRNRMPSIAGRSPLMANAPDCAVAVFGHE